MNHKTDRNIRLNILMITLLACAFPALGVAQDEIVIARINVSGLERTDKQVIIDELGFDAHDAVSCKQIEQGIQNVKNTNLFTNISYEIKLTKADHTLSIRLEERWTTIPILKLSSGGGVNQLIMGVYDPNIFGEYAELGAQYEILGDTRSGVVWFKKPRLWGGDYGLDIQYWNINRLRTKYELDAESPIVKSGFLQQREKLFIQFNKTYSTTMKADMFYEFNKDSFSDNLLTDEVKALLSINGLPPKTEFHFLGFSAALGALNIDEHLVDGALLESKFRYGLSTSSGIDSFIQADIHYRYYKTVANEVTIAQRLKLGSTTTNVLQYWYYLGGLDSIRGFADNRFAGKHYWLSNSEIRYPFYQNDWAVVQASAFLDMATTTETLAALTKIEAASVGLGLRFTLPKVYRFVFRLDFAQPILRDDVKNISFGVQQFF